MQLAACLPTLTIPPTHTGLADRVDLVEIEDPRLAPRLNPIRIRLQSMACHPRALELLEIRRPTLKEQPHLVPIPSQQRPLVRIRELDVKDSIAGQDSHQQTSHQRSSASPKR